MRLSACIPALRFCIFVLAFSLAVALNATAATKAVKFGKLWDGHGTIVNAVVIVENDKIQSVAASGTIPAGAEIIDLSTPIRNYGDVFWPRVRLRGDRISC